MKITSVEEIELNEFYDPRRSFDGGGYHQPEYTISFDDGGEMVIEDRSCGAFGSRVFVEYKNPKKNIRKAAYYGTMLEQRLEYSEFDESDIGLLDMIADEFRYHIPIAEEL